MSHIEIDKPDCGWSGIILEDDKGNRFSGSLSIVQDVPGLFLSKALSYFQGEDVVINVDEEGTSYIIVLAHYEDIYVMINRTEKTQLVILDIGADEFFAKVVADLEHNIDDWAAWNVYAGTKEEYDKEVALAKEELIKQIVEVKDYINKKMARHIKTTDVKED